MTTFQDELALTLGALELGIIPNNTKSIDQALASLSPEEARTVKRKFRKIKRKLIRDHLKQGRVTTRKWSSPVSRARVEKECREVGWRIISGRT
jgi:hypothetical protein